MTVVDRAVGGIFAPHERYRARGLNKPAREVLSSELGRLRRQPEKVALLFSSKPLGYEELNPRELSYLRGYGRDQEAELATIVRLGQ